MEGILKSYKKHKMVDGRFVLSSEIEKKDNLSSYVKVQMAIEEYCLFERTWEVKEYLDGSVEYHGIDVNDEEHIRRDRKNTAFCMCLHYTGRRQ